MRDLVAGIKLARGVWRKGARPKATTFLEDRSGASLMLFAVTLPILLGMAGLGYDGTIWYMTKRQIQTVADNGALSGVHAMLSAEDVTQAVIDDAQRNSFTDDLDGDIQVNVPPLLGPKAGMAGHVEVMITQPGLKLFSSVILGDAVNIRARAVASLVTTGNDHCLLALDDHADGALSFDGNADAHVSCGVASNSKSSTSISVDGSAYLAADPAQAYGDISITGNGYLEHQNPMQPFAPKTPDPYAGSEWPTQDQLDEPCEPQPNNKYNNDPGAPLEPGVYCDHFNFGSQANVTLNPGVYILKNVDFVANGGATVFGDGVTFILMGDPSSQAGNINNINGGANLTLIAPGPGGHASGPFEDKYAGMLFMQDPNAPSTKGNNLITNVANGGANMDLRGALYFKNQNVTFSGNAQNGNGCLQIVARTITITGSTTLTNDPVTCANQGVTTIDQRRVRVTE